MSEMGSNDHRVRVLWLRFLIVLPNINAVFSRNYGFSKIKLSVYRNSSSLRIREHNISEGGYIFLNFLNFIENFQIDSNQYNQ